MKNTFLKSLMVMAAVVASFAFTACDESDNGTTSLDPDVELSVETLAFTQAEESKSFDITVDADWKVEVPTSADWVTVTPMKGGAGQHTLNVSVAANNSGSAREAIVRVIALHPVYDEWDIEKLTISQSANEEEIKPLEVVYSDNFDKKEAVKDGNFWPWLKDTAADYTNPQGSGAANVAYESANVTVRANSASDSNYSDYAGSGLNNLFFGARINYVTVSGIEMPAEGDCFVLTFGSEKFSQEGDSTFNNDEFHVYVSSDNTLWSEVEYAFEEGDELSGRWNDAKASFRLASVPSTLSIMVSADVASVYRLDDLQLSSGGEGAQLIDLTQGVENPNEPETPDTPDTPVEGSFFTDNFDKKEAVKDASGYWPYFSEDGTSEYGNAVGDGAATVSYDSHNVTARANSMSNGSYSAYEGSGLNNLFFGNVENYAIIKDITLPAGEDTFMMTFGAEKYTKNGDSVFKYDEFHVYLSADNATWSEITYSFADGDNLDGTWNDASATFRLTEVPAKLSVKFSVTAASVYRLDDLTLGVAESATQDVTLSEGTTPEPPVQGEVVKATVAEFLAAAEDETVYELTGVISNVTNTTYGNFDLTDETGTVYIYGLSSPQGEQKYWAASGAKAGDTITLLTLRTSYNGTPQGKDAIFVSLVPGEGGDEPTPEPAEGQYASDAAFVCTTDNSDNASYGHGATTIGGEAVTGFKLGTGKKTGYFKSAAVGVDGDKYLNFYAVAWNGKSATLYMRVDGGETLSFTLNANAGATGNVPYTALTAEASDHYSVKLEGLTASSTIEFSTDASFAAVTNETSGRAIVFGMKLTDEPIGTETPGEGPGETPEEPEQPTDPSDVMTIAEALAVGQGNTIGGIIEGVVVSNFELNNLTSKKGMYVQDETGALQFYLGANHEYTFGTKLRIDLTTASLADYNGAVQVSGLTLDKIEVISTGNSVTPKTVTMADFLANKYEGQYIALEGVQVVDADLSKTWVMSGAHTSINMEDANGNKFVVFSSKYASYGTQTVAQGSGTIKGISSISKGVMQIIFAQSSDYASLTGERLGDAGGEEPAPEPEPEEPTPGVDGYAGRDDFATVAHNSQYIARQSTAGWVGENCAVQSGGASDANPVLPSLLGPDTNTRAWVMNGKTTAVGKITSPVLTTGCGTLKFTYGLAFTDKNGFDFNVDIIQNGEVVKTFNVKKDAAKYDKFTFEEEVNVAGEFQIVFSNNCPTASSTGNKDRYSIWDVMWTAHN